MNWLQVDKPLFSATTKLSKLEIEKIENIYNSNLNLEDFLNL